MISDRFCRTHDYRLELGKREKQFDFSSVTSILLLILRVSCWVIYDRLTFLVNEMTKIAAAGTLCNAAEQGDAMAQFSLGVCYQNGWGVGRDEAEAMHWYRKAAEQGYVLAREALKELQVK